MSPHFTLEELSFSDYGLRHGIVNVPDRAHQVNLARLCNQVLEPLRTSLKKPIIVTSGYRCYDINKAIHGSPRSAHVDGRAADFHVNGLSIAALYRRIVDTPTLMAVIDQVIYEFGGWVHVGIPVAGKKPRQEKLVIFEPNQYLKYTPEVLNGR